MVYLIPLLLSFVLNGIGLAMQNFNDQNFVENIPLISAFFIGLSSAIFLNNMVLYPRNFRPIGKIAKCGYEFLLCGLIIEVVVSTVWCAFENQITAVLPAVGDIVLDLSEQLLGDWNGLKESLCMVNVVLHDEKTLQLAGVLISLFVLLGTFHLANIVDIMVLFRCGPKVFLMDLKTSLIRQKDKLILCLCSDPCPPSRATSQNMPKIRGRSRNVSRNSK